MSLKDDIEAVNKTAAQQIPENIRNDMANHVKELAESQIVEKSAQVGTKIPDFDLPDGYNNRIHLEDLRAKGPVVISFYRGDW
jgi:hypothetical protein